MAIANGYATLAQIKSALRIPSADATDDALLEMAVESASRLIDAYCSRNFIYGGTAATTRYFQADDPYVVQIDDARSITQVQTSSSEDGIYDVTWDLTAHTGDIQPEPLNDYVGGLTWPYTRLRAIGDYVFPVDRETTVKVTAVYGWPTVPVTVALPAATVRAISAVARAVVSRHVTGRGCASRDSRAASDGLVRRA